jgi:drug/metabolite transporter superfamily protein YnfA
MSRRPGPRQARSGETPPSSTLRGPETPAFQALGTILVLVCTSLVKPGQSAPLNWFPYAALGVVIVGSVSYAVWLSRRDPGLGDRAGSIVADEQPRVNSIIVSLAHTVGRSLSRNYPQGAFF